MTQVFLSYIKNVSMFVLLLATIEIICPGEKFKNFINIVLGFMLIAIVLKPATALFNIPEMDMNEIFSKTEISLNNNIFNKELEMAKDKQNELIIKNYKQNIAKSIEDILEQNYSGNARFEIRADVDEDMESAGFGAINDIFIDVYENGEKSEEMIGIKPVSVMLDEPLDNAISEKDENLDMKNLIKHFYNLPFDNIHITVQTNE